MGRTHGTGAGGEGDLQNPERESDGESAPGQAKDAMGRQCSPERHIPGVRDWQVSARDRGQWKAVVEAAVGLQTF